MKKYTSLKVIFFIIFFFICNPKLCINQEIKVNEGDFLIFFFSDSVSKSLKVT